LFETTSDETLRNISQITVEFHDFVPESIIKAHTVRRIRTRLKSLGFLCMPFSHTYPGALLNTNLLFIRTETTNIHPDDRTYFRQLKVILELARIAGVQKFRKPAYSFAPLAIPPGS